MEPREWRSELRQTGSPRIADDRTIIPRSNGSRSPHPLTVQVHVDSLDVRIDQEQWTFIKMGGAGSRTSHTEHMRRWDGLLTPTPPPTRAPRFEAVLASGARLRRNGNRRALGVEAVRRSRTDGHAARAGRYDLGRHPMLHDEVGLEPCAFGTGPNRMPAAALIEDSPDNSGSTLRGQLGILMDVHSVFLPGNGVLATLSFLGRDRVNNLLKDHTWRRGS